MQLRPIGSLQVSAVGLGTNNFGGRIDESRAAAVITAALDAGINFFDTSDTYGGTHSEEIIGRHLGSRRDEVVLATKFGSRIDDARPGGARPEYARAALEDSLRRLRTDRIELYILHRPDPTTPIGDTLGVLDELVGAGKVREIGCSNFSLAQLEEAEAATVPGAARLVNLQNRYSLLQRDAEAGLLAHCEEAGIAFVPHSPLAAGLLTGKYRRNEPPPEGSRIAGLGEERRDQMLSEDNFAVVEALEEFCAARGHTILELAFSWLLARPAVASVIAGATSPEQVAANVAAADWSLSPDELSMLDKLAPPT